MVLFFCRISYNNSYEFFLTVCKKDKAISNGVKQRDLFVL
jgi:hypothetical protein